MTIIWPLDLPQSPMFPGSALTPQNSNIETPAAAGPSPIRPRYVVTAGWWRGSVTFRCTAAQRASMLAFYRTSINYGSLPFEITNPLDGTIVNALMRSEPVSAPQTTPVATGYHLMTFDLEILPS